MMKFKSLFRRGHQNPIAHPKQHRQRLNSNQQQQQALVQSESNNSNFLDRNSRSSDIPFASDNEKACSSRTTSIECIARIQELEHECENLKKERDEFKLFKDQEPYISQLKEQHNLELTRLMKENEILRNRLKDVSHSPLSDAEKQQLLDFSRHHNSAPASIALSQEDNSGIVNAINQENARNPIPEWDKRSSSSEVSVACLQDKILQMEETHYSTNEELQATIQELSDLQMQLTELQADNERLAEEKGVLLESLCRQTEKLEDSRTKVDTLQGLLLREENPEESEGYNTEREQKLVNLLKSAQEERENLLGKQNEMITEIKALRTSAEISVAEIDRLSKRIIYLESTIDAANIDKKLLDLETAQSRKEASNRNIENNRLAVLLENAKAKIEELEQTRNGERGNETSELLDVTRKEKDSLETQTAMLQEQLTRSHWDHDRLRDQYSQLQEEFKIFRKNAEAAIKDLQMRLNQLKDERENVTAELQLVRDSLAELQVQCQRHMEDKREMKSVLNELQRREREGHTKQIELEHALEEEKKMRKIENDEWEQFQTDLLMTVRVANDFKTEAQTELERVVMENKTQRDKLRALEAQLDKLNNTTIQKNNPPNTTRIVTPTETQQSILSTVQQEMATRRKTNSNFQDSRLSVRSLIESIENATKQVKAGSGSRSSSTSSLNSMETSDYLSVKNSLRDQQLNNLICTSKSNHNKSQPNNVRKSYTDTQSFNAKSIDFGRRGSVTDLLEKKDPLLGLVKNGGSRRNALLKWCQNKTVGYRNIDITNFSSSWTDGLAFCAILHTYLPEKVPYDSLNPSEKRKNFSIAFAAAESVGIPTTLNIGDMCQLERPEWQQVMTYITSIYKHFET